MEWQGNGTANAGKKKKRPKKPKLSFFFHDPMFSNLKRTTRSMSREVNLMEIQKKSEVLEARERSKDLGQEGSILDDGNKTGPKSKGNGNSKGNTVGNRSIFSPGPLASIGGNLEDKIVSINPGSSSTGDFKSQSMMEVSAAERHNLPAVQTVEILGPTAEPCNKRPFPPGDKEKKRNVSDQKYGDRKG